MVKRGISATETVDFIESAKNYAYAASRSNQIEALTSKIEWFQWYFAPVWTTQVMPGDPTDGSKGSNDQWLTRPGKRLQFAIENGPFIVSFPIKNDDFP